MSPEWTQNLRPYRRGATVFRTAPSGKTPVFTKRQSAIKSLRARAHNPELAQSGTARPKPALIPLRQGTVRLEAAPGPGDLNRHRPDMPIARFGDPQFTA